MCDLEMLQQWRSEWRRHRYLEFTATAAGPHVQGRASSMSARLVSVCRQRFNGWLDNSALRVPSYRVLRCARRQGPVFGSDDVGGVSRSGNLRIPCFERYGVAPGQRFKRELGNYCTARMCWIVAVAQTPTDINVTSLLSSPRPVRPRIPARRTFKTISQTSKCRTFRAHVNFSRAVIGSLTSPTRYSRSRLTSHALTAVETLAVTQARRAPAAGWDLVPCCRDGLQEACRIWLGCCLTLRLVIFYYAESCSLTSIREDCSGTLTHEDLFAICSSGMRQMDIADLPSTLSHFALHSGVQSVCMPCLHRSRTHPVVAFHIGKGDTPGSSVVHDGVHLS